MDLFALGDDEGRDNKCGEVFLTTKGQITIHCTLCEVIYKNFHSYSDHLLRQHAPSFKYWEKSLYFEPEICDEDDLTKIVEEDTLTLIYEKVEPINDGILPDIRENFETIKEVLEEDEMHINLLTETPNISENENTEDEILSEGQKSKTNPKNSRKKLDIPLVVRNVKKRTFMGPSNIRDEDRKHKCPVCCLAFKDRNNMRQHLKRHSDEKNHACPKCDKKFYTPSEVKIHLKSHTNERNFLCNDCGKSYKSNFQLTNHQKRHQNKRDFLCSACDKAFFDCKTLKDHMTVHSTKRPFICSICSSTFPRILALKNHMKLHENKRAYKCKLCEASFNQQAGLLSHIRINHRNT